MPDPLFATLADCTQYRQTLLARPPRIVHGTVVLCLVLLGTALLWLWLTTADLVVRAAGRIRPVASATKVIHAGNSEALNASVGGVIVEVNFHQGELVRKGDVLVRLATERLDNELAKRNKTIQAAEEELGQLARLEKLLIQQFEASRSKTKAELAQAAEEIALARKRQAAEIELARIELDVAGKEERRAQRLADLQSIADADLIRIQARFREAAEKLARAQVPAEGSRLDVLRQALNLVEKDWAVKCEELRMKCTARQNELDAARLELANLDIEKRQAILRAPIDGVIVSEDVKVGDVVERGKEVVAIAPQKGFLFEAAIPSEEVGQLKVGMAARIRLDAYDYQKYGTLAGKVVFVSPDSGLPAGQRTPLYLVKIELSEDEVGRGELRSRVRLGMAGQVEIVTQRESLLVILAGKIRRTISLG
jgi:HlyD family secretion protein